MIKKKIKAREELAKLCQKWKREGKRIGFTSGAFDLIHGGHVKYLEEAKKLCDVLIVGLNSDSSVKRYKGPHRPILPQDERAQIIGGLESVDYLFIFEERRNKENIEALKPDYYIKGGDYPQEELTSKEAIEKLGGEVKIIPILFKTSTTKMVERILSTHPAISIEARPKELSPAIFLDRDGTINLEVEYLHEPEKFQFLPKSIEGMKTFGEMGFRLIIITTQAGIGLGYFSKEDFFQVNRRMLKELSQEGVLIDRIYFCPHSLKEKCNCRKPNIGLIERAREDLNLDLKGSWFIGDKTSDLEMARRADLRAVLVKTGYGGSDGEFEVQPEYMAADLLDAALYILNKGK